MGIRPDRDVRHPRGAECQHAQRGRCQSQIFWLLCVLEFARCVIKYAARHKEVVDRMLTFGHFLELFFRNFSSLVNLAVPGGF